MGYVGTWLIVRGGTGDGLRALGFTVQGEGEAPGWMFATVPRKSPFEQIDVEACVAAASRDHGPAICAYVYDSDFGLIATAEGGAVQVRAIINQENAEAEGLDVVGVTDVAAFARWTEMAPNAATEADLVEVLGRHWTFAEEAVQELFNRIGLRGRYWSVPAQEDS